MAEHPQVTVTVGDRTASVDQELGPLIRALWRLDIDTRFSCQESSSGRAYVCFADAAGAARMCDIVARHDDEGIDSLYNRIRQIWHHENDDDQLEWEDRRVWWFETRAVDTNVTTSYDISADGSFVGEEVASGPPAFRFLVTIHFPREDIPILIEHLNRAGCPSPANSGRRSPAESR